MRALTIDDMHIGEVFHHKEYGDYTIIDYVGRDNKHHWVRVKFHTTGFEKDVRIRDALKGIIRDPYYPTVFGMGYSGEYEMADDVYRIHSIWRAMMSRNYNPKDKDYPLYGGSGVTVDPRWHNFANFLEDFRKSPNYAKWRIHKGRFHLDKDLLQRDVPMNQRVYSPETCQLIDNTYNTSFRSGEKTPEYSDYMNIHKSDGTNYYTVISLNGTTYRATFDNDYYASIYRETILDNRNLGVPIPVDVPRTIEAFKEAQQHRRTSGNNKYPYKQMYHIIDKEDKDEI